MVGKGWTPAAELRAGDNLLLQSGKSAIITGIECELLQKPIKVYNLEVEDWHTYYVSQDGILVHNACWRGVDNANGILRAGEHTVYTLRDPISRDVKYVGRTVNPSAREAAHKLTAGKEDLVFTPIKTGLTYDQARGAEQLLFDANGGVDTLLNRIRPISPRNPNYSSYIDAASDLFK